MNNFDLESISYALGGRRKTRTGWICRCPAHDDQTPSLSLSVSNGRLLAHCFAGCSFEDIIAGIELFGFSTNSYRDRSPDEHATEYDKSAYAQEIWNQSIPAVGTKVETYLRARGYTGVIPATIRYHPSLKHSPSGKRLPAMVSAVMTYPSETVSAIHRTFLRSTGHSKAGVPQNKMMLGAVKGGAVMFGDRSGKTLWVAEGIETALSLYLSTNEPTWAALSTSGMSNIRIPPVIDVPLLMIAADHDLPGITAAHKLASAQASLGREVKVVVPLKPGQDFNDALKE